MTAVPASLAAWQPGLAPRTVTTAVFFAFALGLGLWAGAIPVLTTRAGLDAAGLGLALMLNTGAYIVAMVAGGLLVRWVPARRLMVAGLLAQAAGVVAVFVAPSGPGLTLAIAALGAASGLLDLAMNTEGTAVERDLGRPVLTRMHAAASAAFALGALGGSVLSVDAGPLWCLPPALGVSLAVALAASRLAPRPPQVASVRAMQPAPDAPAPPAGAPTPGAARSAARASAQTAAQTSARTAAQSPAQASVQTTAPAPAPGAQGGSVRPVLVLGMVLGVSVAAEVSAQMWSARFLHQQSAQLAALAGAGAALFAGCQAGVRVFGDGLRQRVGDGRLIAMSLLLAALGFGLVAVAGARLPWLSPLHGFAPAVAGFALVGLGTACVVPCAYALIAQRAPQHAAAALGKAALVAGLVRLPTPLLLGLVASTWSDAVGFAGLALALALGALLAWRSVARGAAAGPGHGRGAADSDDDGADADADADAGAGDGDGASDGRAGHGPRAAP